MAEAMQPPSDYAIALRKVKAKETAVMIAESEQAQRKVKMEEVKKRDARASARLAELAVRKHPKASKSSTKMKSNADMPNRKSRSRSKSVGKAMGRA